MREAQWTVKWTGSYWQATDTSGVMRPATSCEIALQERIEELEKEVASLEYALDQWHQTYEGRTYEDRGHRR